MSDLLLESNAVHVSFDIDVRKVVEAARNLQPMETKILLISGASATDFPLSSSLLHAINVSETSNSHLKFFIMGP